METTIHAEPARRSTLATAQAVAHDFLMAALPDVTRVDVTKVAHVDIRDVAWQAEADVWQPNPVLQSLGIETGRPVLDHHRYLVQLDAELNVLEYEME